RLHTHLRSIHITSHPVPTRRPSDRTAATACHDTPFEPAGNIATAFASQCMSLHVYKTTAAHSHPCAHTIDSKSLVSHPSDYNASDPKSQYLNSSYICKLQPISSFLI